MFVLTLGVLVLGLSPVAANPTEDDREHITLSIDFDGKAKNRKIEIPWKKGQSILGAMQWAKQNKKLDFKYRGKGVSAFLTEIESVKNEGANGRNWIFRVNSKLGQRSFGVVLLKAGDLVEWNFGKYRPDPRE